MYNLQTSIFFLKKGHLGKVIRSLTDIVPRAIFLKAFFTFLL